MEMMENVRMVINRVPVCGLWLMIANGHQYYNFVLCADVQVPYKYKYNM